MLSRIFPTISNQKIWKISGQFNISYCKFIFFKNSLNLLLKVYDRRKPTIVFYFLVIFDLIVFAC